ncbi:alpha/beta hydrolase [Mannheimia sp. AT1]|uniref:Alpha/beta hydrolase n=1 Tax=Mannheimia cairinae TaxID=3025936 RepID=A0ABT5MT81_9PAST|nr:alpha/beta hydrolase [Mannheimia cairinae]MDD0824816.1 alpha/beta hydrolase [Mannheimia cairinae]MDD0826254.1 alpha/beta hydrolase [Mannheimia cairinae]
MKLKSLSTALLTTFLGVNTMANALPTSATQINIPAQTINLTQEWDKIFPKSDLVEHRKVTFKNRFGITLVGDLYIPKNASGNMPAIAVSGPFGAVKEQVSGLYAQTLAERGFVTLAFDGSYSGESSGLPRNMPSPEIYTEDFSAAVDFLGNLDNANQSNIGILGICGWGGFALNSAILDTRIKAVATSTMYDMTRVTANGYNDSLDADARYKMKQDINQIRFSAAQKDYTELLPPNNLRAKDFKADTPQFIKEYSDFYTTQRGFHIRSANSNPEGSWATTGFLGLINMPILQYAKEMRTPTLIVHGENAHSRYFSEDAFKALGNADKELYIVPDATHVDLYDNQAGKIPFDKFEQFFKTNLK